MHLLALIVVSVLSLVTSFSIPHPRSGQFSSRRRTPPFRAVAPTCTARTLLCLIPAATITSVLGGILSGGLHAISGPDHLAAVLPRCLGKRWWVSCRIGAVWALGHGVSASLLGIFAFFLKDRFSKRLGSWTFVRSLPAIAELAVGFSLVAIGAFGISEARSWKPDSDSPDNVFPAPRKGGNRAVLLNGVLHGFSWDGTPSLAPALALPNASAVLVFLMAYCFGTMIAMSAVTTIIGEGSLRVGKKLDKPNLPQKLSFASSALAMVVGFVWTGRALYGLVL